MSIGSLPQTAVEYQGNCHIKYVMMKRILYIVADAFAAVVVILLLLDPTRPLAPVLVLLALAVACWVGAWVLPR